MSDTLALDKKLTAAQVAEMIGVNVHTIYKWARLGTIPCIKVRGWILRFKQSDIERWLSQQTTGKF